MKKIFLLMLIMGAFSPLINAYEYQIYERIQEFQNNRVSESFIKDINGNLLIENIYGDGHKTYNNSNNSYTILYDCKIEYNTSNQKYYKLENFFKDDLLFLNDLYKQYTNVFLNYLYNNSSFSNNNHINYTNFILLYNSDGLAVESIVNGVWAGLYKDSEKGVSGRLYSSGGQLLYVNGKPINWMESQLIKLMDMVESSLRETVDVLGSLVPIIVAAVFVLLILYFVVSVGRRAIMPLNVKVRKRFLGSHNDEC